LERRKSNILQDLAGLFLPRRCSGCDQALMAFEHSLCEECVADLPRLRGHDDPENKVEQVFRGRLRLNAASAFLQFTKNGMVQNMLHRLKYKGDRDLGLELGRRMAADVMSSRRFADVDTALAVPLHPRKQRQRGFNQSQVLVDGMLEVWPLQRTARGELLRVTHTSSQTRRGRLDRWSNVKEAFLLAHPDSLKNAHVLLVDDVVTTGATLEGCAKALAHVPGIRISVLACACA
jgi:ComF family protein